MDKPNNTHRRLTVMHESTGVRVGVVTERRDDVRSRLRSGRHMPCLLPSNATPLKKQYSSSSLPL